jgi:hypothetical protein
MARKKVCKLCGKNPATVPDRNMQGRFIPEICSECHAKRLREDLKEILANTKGGCE